MPTQKPINELKKMLFTIGGVTLTCAKNQALRDKTEEAVDAFVDFLEQLPGIVEKNPKGMEKDFGIDLVKAGIAYGPATFAGRITLPVGRAFGLLGKKNPSIVWPGTNCLMQFIQGGETWKVNTNPVAHCMRRDALEMVLSAYNEIPEQASPDLVRVVTEAIICPFFVDLAMAEPIARHLTLPDAMPAGKIAQDTTFQARETLKILLTLNPDLIRVAKKTMENMVKKTAVERLPFEELYPVVSCAMVEAEKTIFEAEELAAASKNRAPPHKNNDRLRQDALVP